MRQIGLLVIVIAFFQYQLACQSRQQSDSQPTDSTTASVEAGSSNVTLTNRLAGLGLTSTSDWRGINLGDDFSKVKTTEKGEAFESDASHVGYTIEFENLETADMLYYQTNQKVSAIEVDLFLTSRQSVSDYQKELTPYFTARYGTPKPNGSEIVWKGSKGETVTLKDVSKGKDFGLKIKISPSGGVTTASAR